MPKKAWLRVARSMRVVSGLLLTVYSHYATKRSSRKGWDSAKGSGKGEKGPQVFSYVVANSITYGSIRCKVYVYLVVVLNNCCANSGTILCIIIS